MIVVPFFSIVLDISIIGIVVHIPHIFILVLSLSTLHIVSLEVISQRRILVVGNALELSIGIETEYQGKKVVGKAEN